jgi:two-component system sensor histidine kinase UhpB
LFRRVASINAAVLIGVAVVIFFVVGKDPHEKAFTFDEQALLVGGMLVLGLMNVALLRKAFVPLDRLRRFAGEVNSTKAGRIEMMASAEVQEVALAFNQMLDRLDSEQLESARRVIAAQEAERRRIAQELHDEVGQTLTGVLLQLSTARTRAPLEMQVILGETLESARKSLEDVRRIAVELRPETLDDLGLPSAIVSLCERVTQLGKTRIERDIDRQLPALTVEQELVVYRVAQEAMTNVLRHSGSSKAWVSLHAHEDGSVRLVVRDRGRGLSGTKQGTGMRGMRERADLIGATLSIAEDRDGGARVELTVPI